VESLDTAFAEAFLHTPDGGAIDTGQRCHAAQPVSLSSQQQDPRAIGDTILGRPGTKVVPEDFDALR